MPALKSVVVLHVNTMKIRPILSNVTVSFRSVNIHSFVFASTYFCNFFSYDPFNERVRKYSVILSVLDPKKCEYLKDRLDFEHAYITTYLAS